ncbi:chromate efflux transporter [Synechococcus sp. Cruz-9H2]|uniref:chromate efflux transporter n=1 Tax=unclassified Synechococcus TaxID=2626047 RepID=UPI0020CD98A8|nr:MULTISPECIES: chromate efflux transporter [unclassified Synechococcus]MCP9820302.1 chromate efflux transporter [Synechococcus sp. Cruz-9H2]MCP9844610.1 chromate efflux transporter [Synechococcus sp. Edmonson 11F2]MCP9856732.1 chromate efflux transporter [Synechococcus sp. Cruz-9C9]MCP9864058.1 chromate efflux transporter [Synechococcus sp. Cruz-7E5]MCP9871253.1 chromate efflux transporter [Synechococcus sp. Cruz-7B9]
MSLSEASRFWLKLGLVSFGGPAGQIALLHRELVERRRWLSERRFLHALNYCMLLPGPEATQLATYLGWLMHGVPGGLIAGGLFLAPSVLVLTALATVYALWGQLPLLVSVFAVLKPTVLAIVLVAAWRLGLRTLRTPVLIGIAVAAFLALAVLQLPYPLVVVGAALCGLVVGRWRSGLLLVPGHSAPPPQQSSSPTSSAGMPEEEPIHGDHTSTPEHARFSRRRLALTLLAWGMALLIPLALLTAAGGWNGNLALMARFFSRVALLSFGGAYAVLPYVAQGAVEQFGWLSAGQMVDGLALGETTPGPLIMVVAFVGFMGGWNSTEGSWPAAAAATLVTVWFTFLPSFGFILTGAPLVEASRGDLRLGAPLTAITAAVVGVIASLAVFLAGPVLWPNGRMDPAAALVVALALLVLVKLRWSVLQLIGAAAAIGAGTQLLAKLVGS